MSSWLPGLVRMSDHGNDWSAFLEAIYQHFCNDFIKSKPVYPGKRFNLKRFPLSDGKEVTFWHLISSGADESNRQIDMPRCKRIRWPRPMIEATNSETVCVWKNQRGRNKRILIALDDFSYLVVLEERKDYVLLWTAYSVEQQHRRRKHEKEYKKWKAEAGND